MKKELYEAKQMIDEVFSNPQTKEHPGIFDRDLTPYQYMDIVVRVATSMYIQNNRGGYQK